MSDTNVGRYHALSLTNRFPLVIFTGHSFGANYQYGLGNNVNKQFYFNVSAGYDKIYETCPSPDGDGIENTSRLNHYSLQPGFGGRISVGDTMYIDLGLRGGLTFRQIEKGSCSIDEANNVIFQNENQESVVFPITPHLGYGLTILAHNEKRMAMSALFSFQPKVTFIIGEDPKIYPYFGLTLYLDWKGN